MSEPKLNPEFAEDIKSKSSDYDRRLRKRIRIDVADMQLALLSFKSNVIRKHFATPALGLIGAWLPVISSDFKQLGNLSSDEVKWFYIGIVVCITFFIVKTWVWPIRRSWPVTLLWPAQRSTKISTSDPEQLAEILHERGLTENTEE